MMRYLLFCLALVGCVQADECRRSCSPRLVKSVSKDQCLCDDKTVEDVKPHQEHHFVSEADAFCSKCKEDCAPSVVKHCAFGNDTWGAGPDVCECYEHRDGGKD